ncbi:tetratricopeptide repeat protein [Spirulina subsalsa]|uniref:tetratricopeptide repeat protein n=1 Tax=Spirulina subsalsa TaxID=54311 RepID=UPI0022383D2A|nr:tetratricopeptide repeat protein [Spirulina subsalsa]
MKDFDIQTLQLLAQLKDPDEGIREQATAEFWNLWLNQKGELGLEYLKRAQALLDNGEFTKAEQILTKTIQNYPDFAEAWNRRAVLYYTQSRYLKSQKDCQKVVELNPIHFGAWHGLGLCYAAVGKYKPAIHAFRKALEIQPYATINQKLILECTMRL